LLSREDGKVLKRKNGKPVATTEHLVEQT